MMSYDEVCKRIDEHNELLDLLIEVKEIHELKDDLIELIEKLESSPTDHETIMGGTVYNLYEMITNYSEQLELRAVRK